MGPTEGEPITYTWNPFYNLIWLLPWVLVILVIVLLPENRRAPVFWILIPLILLRILWAGLLYSFDLGIQLSPLVDSLLFGFTINWLLAERIGNRNRAATWLLACVVFAIVLALSVIGLGNSALPAALAGAMTIGILIISLTLAAVFCRKKFYPSRFSVWTALWIIFLCLPPFLFIALVNAFMSNNPIMLLFHIATAYAIFALSIIGSLIPFEILLFSNRFWRHRFNMVFGLEIQEKPPEQNAENAPEDM
ncbi:MAG: hypothetical protein K9N48_05035 [Verrucomicrobia bacterium]|nr:hypothetical protein [Verrucomicrobiota bacterium]MCF7707936.1 hypothetical protein [Verrucomicrobiota bacterium]